MEVHPAPPMEMQPAPPEQQAPPMDEQQASPMEEPEEAWYDRKLRDEAAYQAKQEAIRRRRAVIACAIAIGLCLLGISILAYCCRPRPYGGCQCSAVRRARADIPFERARRLSHTVALCALACTRSLGRRRPGRAARAGRPPDAQRGRDARAQRWGYA